MRTTVNLDTDVVGRLHAETRTREETFRKTLNDVIRDGLELAERRRKTTTKFRVKPRAIGLKRGLSHDSISKLLELGEGDDAR